MHTHSPGPSSSCCADWHRVRYINSPRQLIDGRTAVVAAMLQTRPRPHCWSHSVSAAETRPKARQLTQHFHFIAGLLSGRRRRSINKIKLQSLPHPPTHPPTLLPHFFVLALKKQKTLIQSHKNRSIHAKRTTRSKLQTKQRFESVNCRGRSADSLLRVSFSTRAGSWWLTPHLCQPINQLWFLSGTQANSASTFATFFQRLCMFM